MDYVFGSGESEFEAVKTLGEATLGTPALRVGQRIRSTCKPVREPVLPGWKRALDLTLITVTAPLWGLLMLLMACGIKMISRGPVLFRQERVGLGERRFVCLKFRTMHVNAETVTHQQHLCDLVASDAPMTKMDKVDKRLILGARILRSSGLDELPQLFNVIRGEMSLVGPRPCTAFELEHYQEWQRERFNTLPGLTGLWQVSGKNRTSFSKMIELDIHYSRTSCLWLDLGIMLRTFPAVLGQFIDNQLEKAFLPAVLHRRQVNRDLKVNGAAR